jgi:hypothetical protein
MMFERVADPHQELFKELHRSGYWQESLDQPRAAQVAHWDEQERLNKKRLTSTEFLKEWAKRRQLGIQLVAMGVSREKAQAFLRALRDAMQRAHFDDDGRFHPAFRNEDKVDWEVSWAFADDEHRLNPEHNGRAPKHLYGEPEAEEEFSSVDELAMSANPDFDSANGLQRQRAVKKREAPMS